MYFSANIWWNKKYTSTDSDFFKNYHKGGELMYNASTYFVIPLLYDPFRRTLTPSDGGNVMYDLELIPAPIHVLPARHHHHQQQWHHWCSWHYCSRLYWCLSLQRLGMCLDILYWYEMEKSDSHGLGFAHEVLAILEVVDREDQLRRIPNVVASDILRNGSVLIRVRGGNSGSYLAWKVEMSKCVLKGQKVERLKSSEGGRVKKRRERKSWNANDLDALGGPTTSTTAGPLLSNKLRPFARSSTPSLRRARLRGIFFAKFGPYKHNWGAEVDVD